MRHVLVGVVQSPRLEWDVMIESICRDGASMFVNRRAIFHLGKKETVAASLNSTLIHQ